MITNPGSEPTMTVQGLENKRSFLVRGGGGLGLHQLCSDFNPNKRPYGSSTTPTNQHFKEYSTGLHSRHTAKYYIMIMLISTL